MFKGAWFMAWLEVRHLLRARETLLWTFVMPIVFFYFIGTITGGHGGGGGEPDKIALLVPEDAGFLADQLVRRLEEQDYEVIRTASEEEWASHARRLRVPEKFTESVLAGEPVKIEFRREGGGLDGQFDQIRVARAVYSELADLIVVSESGEEPTGEALARLAEQPRSLTIEVEAAGRREEIPTGFEQAAPGITVMFVLFVLFTSGASSLAVERRLGLLRRLASSPMSRGAVVAGKWASRMILGVIQLCFAMLAGWLLFGIDWGARFGIIQLAAVATVLICFAALAVSLGMLLGNFARNEGQAAGLGVAATNVLAGLGGCWWPIEVTPEWAQKLSLALPTGWVMDAMHKLVSFGAPPTAVLPHLTALLIAALLAGWIVARRFRFE